MQSNTVNLGHLLSSTFYTGLKGVLDLDSTNIQLDTLGCTPMPSTSVRSCHLCFFLDEPYFRRSLLTVLLQFIVGRPDHLSYPGTCHYSACCNMRWWFTSHVQTSKVIFLSVCCPSSVAQFQLWPPHLLSCLLKRRPLCSSIICFALQTSKRWENYCFIQPCLHLQANIFVSPDLFHFNKYCCYFSNSRGVDYSQKTNNKECLKESSYICRPVYRISAHLRYPDC